MQVAFFHTNILLAVGQADGQRRTSGRTFAGHVNFTTGPNRRQVRMHLLYLSVFLCWWIMSGYVAGQAKQTPTKSQVKPVVIHASLAEAQRACRREGRVLALLEFVDGPPSHRNLADRTQPQKSGQTGEPLHAPQTPQGILQRMLPSRVDRELWSQRFAVSVATAEKPLLPLAQADRKPSRSSARQRELQRNLETLRLPFVGESRLPFLFADHLAERSRQRIRTHIPTFVVYFCTSELRVLHLFVGPAPAESFRLAATRAEQLQNLVEQADHFPNEDWPFASFTKSTLIGHHAKNWRINIGRDGKASN